MTRWHGTPADGAEVARLRARLAYCTDCEMVVPVVASDDGKRGACGHGRIAALSTPTDADGGPR
jgi:hypothetical protein